ncbi:hypothetical protein LshimejAT787_0113130 [Lyophyllum shimeji]|uniref:Uncharacterized protein n=1 Tax=Lyophyllum shimeji TaxID=47721 RepID=A0A9P3PF72_LYOSH|nr:hypothetical protein LshimejAT787_0113130 [Lyophyllum shimeji]
MLRWGSFCLTCQPDGAKIAFSTPSLWPNIHVSALHPMKYLAAYLKSSGSHGLLNIYHDGVVWTYGRNQILWTPYFLSSHLESKRAPILEESAVQVEDSLKAVLYVDSRALPNSAYRRSSTEHYPRARMAMECLLAPAHSDNDALPPLAPTTSTIRSPHLRKVPARSHCPGTYLEMCRLALKLHVQEYILMVFPP